MPVAKYNFLLVVSMNISPTFPGVVAGAAVPVDIKGTVLAACSTISPLDVDTKYDASVPVNVPEP